MSFFAKTAWLVLCLSLLASPVAGENDAGNNQAEPKTLEQLLQSMRERQSREMARYREREQRFLAERDQQKQLLEEARAEFLALQKKNNPLQQQADENAERIAAMRDELDRHIRDLGDIYSIYNEFAGDFIARMNDSLVQSQLPERREKLDSIQQAERLPGVHEMRELWLLVQEEMTEAGKLRRYSADVVQADGSREQQQVTRLATFSATSDGRMLRYVPESGELIALPRQPGGVRQSIERFENKAADEQGMLPAVIDPTRGSLLGMLGQSPDLQERIAQGREVGMAIIAIGAAGLLLALYRILYLAVIWLKTRRQLRHIDQPLNNNPLGRILQQAAVLQHSDEQTLQSRIDEVILKEIPKLEQGQSLIKLLAAVAPLLGLLGTVIGMIATFQSISLFGSGDPKLMAGGISQALVTTVLGLIAAIPLLFSHNIVSTFSRSLVQVLDEQSAGILARHLEQSRSKTAEADNG